MHLLTGAAVRALKSLMPVADLSVDTATARSIINAARGDVDRALGAARGGTFSGELHAASMNARTGSFAEHGMDGVLAGLRELDGAATATARTRLLVGSTILTGTVLGAAALTRGGNDSVPMAPGPIGERPAGGGSGTSW